MALSHFDITAARPKEKPYKLADGGGLHLLVQPNGNKFWRFRYEFGGVEKMLALGSYPATTLAEARAKRDQARKLIEAGTDPSVQKKIARLMAAAASRNTFKALAEEHVANMAANGAAPITVEKHRWLLQEVAAPLAQRPIADINAAELLDILKRVEKSGRRETAKRLRATMSRVFRLAIVTLRATNDPTVALKGALLRPNVQHHAAITDEKEFGAFLRALDEFDGWPVIRSAMKFLTLTCARPGEVRLAHRDEFNFEKATWRIPAERTKMRRQHDVPLSRQAVAVVQDIWSLSEHAELVFPSIRTNRKALSENAMNSAMRRMGYTKDEVTSHGFRATASTILNEHGYNPDVIEAVLGHQPMNAIRRTYNRAHYWPERVKLMQEWADMLDGFRAQQL
ncbi:MAG: integrase arm-type DNA-binding domain-containing protein [Hyphomicrobiaceae bacterium]